MAAPPLPTSAIPTCEINNPISKIARTFDRQLVSVEDRISWLETGVHSLAERNGYPLSSDLGYRGGRVKADDPDPSITLDLGKPIPLSTIYLVPAQRESREDVGIFPKRFTLELSNREDFGQRSILFTSGASIQPDPDGYPLALHTRETARFIKLTVHEGHNKGALDVFALSELIVIANGDPVSFNAKVDTVGALDVPGIWHSSALIDGRSPLGIWQNGINLKASRNEPLTVEAPNETVTWTLKLDELSSLDRLVLFPYQILKTMETSIFPEELNVQLATSENDPGRQVAVWKESHPGSNQTCPVIIPLANQSAQIIRITAIRPWSMGNRKIQAISEIEAWSNGHNIAINRPVTQVVAGTSSTITDLTDGYSSTKKIIPIGDWLRQIVERGSKERELKALKPLQSRIATESELNATWGSAMVLGLTFLIPVFIVERRRLMSRTQLDQIRKRIASDLHDDIGSNLGSISLIARTARKDLTRLNGPEEIAEDLNEVESIARESSLAMRDIVWLLERKQDSIGDLVERMRETAKRLLREINFTLECESTKTAAKLSLDAKRHLFLFYKEAIHNVLKHSRANTVNIRLWDEGDKLAMEIIDNGVGIPTNTKGEPVTINKLEDRVRLLEGSLHIETSKNKGTRVMLLVKRARLTSHPSAT